VIWYDITLKVSEAKYKICYYCVGSTVIFQFLHTNVLNYRYFLTDCSAFLKINTFEKLKNVKTRFYRKIKKHVYKRLLQLWTAMTRLVLENGYYNEFVVERRSVHTKPFSQSVV